MALAPYRSKHVVEQIKALFLPLRQAMYDFEEQAVTAAMRELFSDDAKIKMPFPLGKMQGSDALYQQCYAPLLNAFPDMERRDFIVMGGQSEQGDYWLGCGGHYLGTFAAPWLDIPPNGHITHLRFHEFYRFEGNKIVEMQAIWDIPEVMMQSNAWPMSPSLGWEGFVPAPATLDGIIDAPHDKNQAQNSCQLIVDMLTHLTKYPSQGGPEVMEMDRFWHPRMNWYGPAGIGSGRGIQGFRHWHQIPFLSAMPDRGQHEALIEHHFFGDANYAAVTGWPNMCQTISNDGWLGIAPTGKRITMCSLDFWRIENGKIRENWVLVDILDVYHQLGVDVFRRMREFNKARSPGSISFPIRES